MHVIPRPPRMHPQSPFARRPLRSRTIENHGLRARGALTLFGSKVTGVGHRFVPDQNGTPLSVVAFGGKLYNSCLIELLKYSSNWCRAQMMQCSNVSGLEVTRLALIPSRISRCSTGNPADAQRPLHQGRWAMCAPAGPTEASMGAHRAILLDRFLDEVRLGEIQVHVLGLHLEHAFEEVASPLWTRSCRHPCHPPTATGQYDCSHACSQIHPRLRGLGRVDHVLTWIVCSMAFGKFFNVQMGIDLSGGSCDDEYDSVKWGRTTYGRQARTTPITDRPMLHVRRLFLIVAKQGHVSKPACSPWFQACQTRGAACGRARSDGPCIALQQRAVVDGTPCARPSV